MPLNFFRFLFGVSVWFSLAITAQAAYKRQTCVSLSGSQTTQYLWHGGMIDAEIQNGQVIKRYIFINLRPVAVIEYENDDKNNSKESNKHAGYSPKSAPKSTAIYAIHTDHLGTPQAIADD